MRFKVAKATRGGRLSKLTIGLGGGLTFHGRRSHGTRTVKGVTVKGARLKSVALSHGRLVIVLRAPVGRSVAVKLGSAALRESSHLRSRASHHRLKDLGVSVVVADAAGRVSHLWLAIHRLGLPPAHR
jgi:hypothetical protein